MLDQDTARALLTIADETGARVALVGDRHQLPAVGRGGVLDHAARVGPPDRRGHAGDGAPVHRPRLRRPEPADAHRRRPGAVFDALHRRGQIVIHATDVERTAALADAGAAGDLVIADTREQVADLNAAIRDHAPAATDQRRRELTTAGGERIGLGDRVATRRNDPDLQVANRADLDRHRHRRGRQPRPARPRTAIATVPAEYARRFVELAYATTVHGAQGETVDAAHVLIGEHHRRRRRRTSRMTRGRDANTAHLVAESLDDARQQWVEVFSRDRADLGPAHARTRAIEDIDRYGPVAPPRTSYRPHPNPPSTSTPLGAQPGIAL